MSRSTTPLSGTGRPIKFVDASDVMLVQSILQREPEALGALYDRYCPLVYTLALKVTDDAAAAETVVAAVFETIWHAAAAAVDAPDIAAWIICITHHHGIAYAQRQKRTSRHVPVSLDAPQQHYQRTSDKVKAPSQHEAVHLALTTLTEAECAAIEGAYYKGLTASQLALLLGTSIAQVKVYLRQGLGKFQDQLGSSKSRHAPVSPVE